MGIQHNITALNAHRNLTNNNSSVGKSLEKLSSGYRINRAGDDALTEVHSMLNRMVELSTQAANGTYSTTKRQEMQKEIMRLNEEIDRISQTVLP